ncbi:MULTISPECIES: formylglycine-generating enzyme family protein [Cyanophyceae]|uniref:Formylglycine-generating enzyme family protein n=1 Tax=Leptolyngbya subtilissima DQ-A4 TaxID=2933933 RepID=A0ABV0KBX1_9CYAN|nr:formylglycine-generating enzyme family protein [Nodosilinea sp. FACHB-141]
MTELLTLEQRHERAERRVNRFVDRFEPAYYDLVCHAALPLILTPELVSYLRNEFLREVPWMAEVDLLLSDLCSPVGYELYTMDADVRAYALAEQSPTFTAERRREVANLLISYVRYLAEHQSYLSDRELEAQQWAAMLCLGEAERQTVVSKLVERFQSAEIGVAIVGADLLDNAEIAHLAQLTETLKPQLADYPELIEYAALVSDVQLRNIALKRARVEKTYVVAPGQFLRLPAALQTELVAKGRIQVGKNVTQQVFLSELPAAGVTNGTQDSSSIKSRFESINELNSLPDHQFEALLFALNLPMGVMPPRSAAQGLRASALLQWIEGPTGPGLDTLQAVLEQVQAEESSAESSVSFPPLEPFEFIEAHFDLDDDPNPFPPPLQPDEFTVIALEVQPDRGTPQDLEPFNFIVATIQRRPSPQQEQRSLFGGLFGDRSNSSEWEILRQEQQAYRLQEPLPGIAPLEMVSIPRGTFLMGSPDKEPERIEREGPQHEVIVPSFFMGRYLVTQAQWRVVAAMPQVERELMTDPSQFKGNNRPVECVTWYDAVEFCARLSAHTGRQYRLPTEAEWEYACRAGTTTPFHFGKTISPELANYDAKSTYADGPIGKSQQKTTPIYHFGIANAFGLSDMHGNVFEWCQDYLHDNYEGAPIDGSAWIAGGNASRRVLRGGSWFNLPWNCRSAYRDGYGPGDDDNYIGFRVCCSAPKALQLPTS